MAETTGVAGQEENEPTGRDLFALLFAGILGWIVAAIGAIFWFFSTASDPGLMAVAFPFYAWLIGYTPGGLFLMIYGLFRWLRRSLPLKVLLWGSLVYFFPLLLMTAVFRIFLYFQPTTVQYGDEPMMISAFAGPGFLFLYGSGLVLGYRRRQRPLAQTVRATIAPPLLGVAFFGAWSLWFTFTSSHWEARGVYTLAEQRVEWRDPTGLIIEGSLEARRDGVVTMHAFYEDRRGNTGRGEPVGKVVIGQDLYEKQSWIHAPLTLRAGESRRIRLIWENLSTTSLSSNRQVIFRITEGTSYMSGPLLREFRIRVDPDPQTLERLESKLSPRSVGGKMGYENRAGKIIIPPQFDFADEFYEGLALVRIGDRFGFINQAGQVVIPIRYFHASRFSEGLAAVAVERGQMGYVDASGKFVIEPRLGGGYPFSEGLARIRVPAEKGYREGFMDRSGQIVISPRWESAHDFSEGMAAVNIDEKWGFIDRAGKLIIEPQFSGGRLFFKNGRANVILENRWGFVDREGSWTPEERG